MIFAEPIWVLTALAVFPLVYLARRQERILVTRARRATIGGRFISLLPITFYVVTALLMVSVICQPMVLQDKERAGSVMGRDIIVALDWSASMGEEYKGERVIQKRDAWYIDPTVQRSGPPVNEDGTPGKLRRIDAAQDSIITYAENRRQANTGDHIALIAFDHKPVLRWPLDRDLKQISRHGSFIPKGKGPQELGEGTNFGNEMPGPFDLAADHFKKKGKSTTRVLILVTDGENEITDETMARLAKVIGEAKMKVYVIGVGEKIGKGELDLERLCREQGGKVFRAESQGQLDSCFTEINSLESSPIPISFTKPYEPVFYVPLALALACYIVGLLFEAMILGR